MLVSLISFVVFTVFAILGSLSKRVGNDVNFLTDTLNTYYLGTKGRKTF